MDLFNSHIDNLRAMEKMRTDQNRLMRMIEPTFARPNSMLPLGGGLTQSGGLSPGGGLMY